MWRLFMMSFKNVLNAYANSSSLLESFHYGDSTDHIAFQITYAIHANNPTFLIKNYLATTIPW